MLKLIRFSRNLLWRQLRNGDWFIVFFAIVLTVTVLTSLNFYTDRLMRGLAKESAKFLGGDLVITSPTPIEPAWILKAKNLQLRTAEVWAYPSVVTVKNQLQLVNLQAVDDNYPLLGEDKSHPEQNSVWVELRLLSMLGVALNDRISIGAANFRIEKTLAQDYLNTGWLIAPRVMMRLSDVPQTRTVLPGSRVDYRLLLAGNEEQLSVFRQWITPQLKPGQRLLSISNQQLILQNILKRTENYFQLVILVCLMMSGVVIALSIRQFLRRHYGDVALMRCLGAKQNEVTAFFIIELLFISIFAGLIGIVLGYLAQNLFAVLFKQYFPFSLPPTSLFPVALGFVISIFLAFTFAFPVIRELPRVSPLYIWRNEIKTHSQNFYYIISFFLLLIFIYYFLDFSLLSLLMLDIVLVTIGFIYAISFLLLELMKKIALTTRGAIRRGLNQLTQHPESTSLQLISFTLVLMSIIVLGITRTSLIQNWQQTLPHDAPNYFAFNIAPTDVASFKQTLENSGILLEGIYPMIRGRLIALNGKPILKAIPPEALGNNALHRELNLSWMWHFPSDNKIVAGDNWPQQQQNQSLISVEKNLADDLHLKLGDQLTFQIGDQTISATIYNLRSLDWASFHPNFYVIFMPGSLQNFSQTYISSFHLKSHQTNILNQLVQQFPNVTIIDVANLLKQVQDLIGQITLAVQYLFLFALAICILILIASIQASMDERRETYHLLRVLGASQKYIKNSLLVEIISLVFLIVIFAIIFAKIAVFLIEKIIFS